MNPAELLQFLSSIAWPVLVAGGLLIFRKQLQSLTEGLGHRTGEFHAGPTGVSWKERQVEEDREEVKRELSESRKALDVPVSTLGTTSTHTKQRHGSPSQRVIKSVTELEDALRVRTPAQTGRGRPPGIHGLAKRAFDEGLFDHAELDSAQGLYNVHLAARRSGDDAITSAMADEVDDVVEVLLEKLRNGSA